MTGGSPVTVVFDVESGVGYDSYAVFLTITLAFRVRSGLRRSSELVPCAARVARCGSPPPGPALPPNLPLAAVHSVPLRGGSAGAVEGRSGCPRGPAGCSVKYKRFPGAGERRELSPRETPVTTDE